MSGRDDGPGGPAHRSASFYRVPRRRGWGRPVAFWVTWVTIAALVSAAFGAWVFVDEAIQGTSLSPERERQIAKVVTPVDRGKPMNVLLVGSDSRQHDGALGNTDTMILVRLDTDQKFISMLSFPRDSWVNIPGHGVGKLNSAYVLGEQTSAGGPATLIKTIESLTGQQVNYYATVDFQAFVQIVNDLGGTYIDIDHYYFHKNGTGTGTYEEIDVKPGYQKHNGDDALDFVRYRHLDSDFARIARQQMFLSELKAQVRGDIGNALRAPLLLRILLKKAKVTIPEDRRLDIVRFAVETPDNRVFRVQATGVTGMEGEQSVVHLDMADLAKQVQLWLQPPFLHVAQKKVAPSSVRIRVLNGSGRGMVADHVARLLAAKGYRAESGGNAVAPASASQVLYNGRVAKSVTAAQGLQPLLGPSTTMVSSSAATVGNADVALVVGSDFVGALSEPPKPVKTVETADVVSTTSLVEKFRAVSKQTGMPLMVPTRMVKNSRVKDVYAYRIGDKKRGPWAVKVVVELPSNQLYPRFWGIMATTMKNPPLLADSVGTWKKGDGLVPLKTYYNGKVLTRDAFTYKGVTYWVSNVLDDRTALNSATIHSVARSFRPIRVAKLPKGAVNTPVTIEDDPRTP